LSGIISQFYTVTLSVNDDLHRVQVQYILHYSAGTLSYSLGIQRPCQEDKHSTPFIAAIKNEGEHASSPSARFHGMCMDNLRLRLPLLLPSPLPLLVVKKSKYHNRPNIAIQWLSLMFCNEEVWV
jgi:hypothetical protein